MSSSILRIWQYLKKPGADCTHTLRGRPTEWITCLVLSDLNAVSLVLQSTRHRQPVFEASPRIPCPFTTNSLIRPTMKTSVQEFRRAIAQHLTLPGRPSTSAEAAPASPIASKPKSTMFGRLRKTKPAIDLSPESVTHRSSGSDTHDNGNHVATGSTLRAKVSFDLPFYRQDDDNESKAPSLKQPLDAKANSRKILLESGNTPHPRFPFSVCDTEVRQAARQLVSSINERVQAISRQVVSLEENLLSAERQCLELRKSISSRPQAKISGLDADSLDRAGNTDLGRTRSKGDHRRVSIEGQEAAIDALLGAHVAENAALDIRATCANRLQAAERSLQKTMKARYDLQRLVAKTGEVVERGRQAAVKARASRDHIIKCRNDVGHDHDPRPQPRPLTPDQSELIETTVIHHAQRAEEKATSAADACRKLIWLRKIVARTVTEPEVQVAALTYMDLQIIQAKNADQKAAAAARTCIRLAEEIMHSMLEQRPSSPPSSLPPSPSPARSSSSVSTESEHRDPCNKQTDFMKTWTAKRLELTQDFGIDDRNVAVTRSTAEAAADHAFTELKDFKTEQKMRRNTTYDADRMMEAQENAVSLSPGLASEHGAQRIAAINDDSAMRTERAKTALQDTEQIGDAFSEKEVLAAIRWMAATAQESDTESVPGDVTPTESLTASPVRKKSFFRRLLQKLPRPGWR